MSVKMDWIEESKKFDLAAEVYDRFSPDYPEEIINTINSYQQLNADSRVLEVGTGTGIATDHFVGNGYRITGIDQGENLLQVAKDKYENLPKTDHGEDQVELICTPLQDWDVDMDSYDMMFSAQTFNWVPKPVGYKKVGKALKSGGSMHLFWNRYMHTEDDVSNELVKLLKKHGIISYTDEAGLESFKIRTTDTIGTSNYFGVVEVTDVPWHQEYTFNEFANYLKTLNFYIGMDNQEKHVLNVELMELFSEHDYKINLYYRCVLFSAMRL